MSEKVKLIIEIPKPMYESVQNGTYCGTLYKELKNGIPLDNDSERAEVQSYFAGEAYGWEEGRKALLDDVKAEIDQLPLVLYAGYDHIEKDSVMQILDNIGNAESIDPNDMTCMFEGVTEVPNDAFKGWHTDELLEQIRKKNNDNPEDTGCDHND